MEAQLLPSLTRLPTGIGSILHLDEGGIPQHTLPEHASGSTFPLGTTTVLVSASDSRGNVSIASFTVTVLDTTAPVATPPANVTAPATSPSGALVSYPAATAADVVGVVSLSYSQNSGTLFSHTLAVTENNYVAENDLGTWLSAQGKLPEAMDCFRESLRIKADNADAFYNLGNAFAKLGDWDEAIGNYRRALQIAPDSPDILGNLGYALAAKKQYAEAIATPDVPAKAEIRSKLEALIRA